MMTKEEKLQLAKQGKELDVLVKDKKITVRRAVMKHQRKQDLEILKNDVYYRLREDAVKSLNK